MEHEIDRLEEPYLPHAISGHHHVCPCAAEAAPAE